MYKKLIVTNPTREELTKSRIPDICLDEVVVVLRDSKGKQYLVKYFPNDYLGVYGSVASTDASPHEMLELTKRRGLDLDDNGISPEKIFKLHDARPNPQIRDKAGVSQIRLANHIGGYTGLVDVVTILCAVYSQIPEEVYANTGFAREKLNWTQ